MQIIKLLPTGFCYGVMQSYVHALKIIKDHPNHKIFMLGNLVHNAHVMKEFKDLNVIILEDHNSTRFQLVEQLRGCDNAILILSAHGTDQASIELAKQRGMKVFDLTCQYVYKTHDLIKQKLDADYVVLFIGKRTHPETQAVLSIANEIILISDEDDISLISLNSNKAIFCTNQTTFNSLKLSAIVNKLKTINSEIEFVNDTCNATTIRQQAIINLDSSIDICLIVSDKQSSNGNELWNLAQKKCLAFLISDQFDINQEWFRNKQKCAIMGAASTPVKLVDEIVNYLTVKIK